MTKKQFMYEEVYEFIKKRIENGIYGVGFKIPSENEFAKVFGIHRKTIRTSIAMLANEGLLKTVPGKGTFVVGAENEIHLLDRYHTDQVMEKSGNIEIVRSVIRKIGNYYSYTFGCSSEDLMYTINLVRNLTEKNLIFEQLFIPVKYIKNFDKYDLKAFDSSEIFKFEGIKINRVQQKLNVVNISKRNGKYLDLENHEKVLLLEKYSYDSHDNCIEYKKQYIRGDLVKITNDFGD